MMLYTGCFTLPISRKSPLTKIHLRSDRHYRKHIDSRRLREAASQTLAHETFPGRAELTIVVTGDEEIRALNRQYRGLDAPTDVLSFGEEHVEAAADETFYLGDVIISYPHAAAQAQAAGHAVADELVLLVVHGVLHLLGHDHVERGDKRRMWAAQADVLREMAAQVTISKQ